MLRSRAFDLVLAAFFLAFVACNVLVELPICRGVAVTADAEDYFVRVSYEWGIRADRVWVEQPHWSRVAVCYHCLFFGPLYLTMALALIFRWNRVRLLAVAVGAMKLYAGAYYMTTNLLHPELSPAEPRLFVQQSASYMVIPLLLVLRFGLYETPFPAAAAAAAAVANKQKKR